jgi:hypothetical protein
MASPQTPQTDAYLAVIATRLAYGVAAGQRGMAMRRSPRGQYEPKAEILVRTVYTCDDRSGDFYAQKNISVRFHLDESSTNTGPITFHGGPGNYTGLTGHGFDNGMGSADGNGVGTTVLGEEGACPSRLQYRQTMPGTLGG